MINAPPKDGQTSAESPAKIEPASSPVVTRKQKTAKPVKTETNEQLLTGKQPKTKRAAKPPTAYGYIWRPNGSGWELRKLVTVEGKRKQPYISHLSKSAFAEMRRRHKGAALDTAIAQWIAEKDVA